MKTKYFLGVFVILLIVSGSVLAQTSASLEFKQITEPANEPHPGKKYGAYIKGNPTVIAWGADGFGCSTPDANGNMRCVAFNANGCAPAILNTSLQTITNTTIPNPWSADSGCNIRADVGSP